VKGSRRFKLLFDQEHNTYFLSNGFFILSGMEVQSLAQKLPEDGGEKKEYLKIHSPLYKMFRIRKAFPKKINSIMMPVA